MSQNVRMGWEKRQANWCDGSCLHHGSEAASGNRVKCSSDMGSCIVLSVDRWIRWVGAMDTGLGLGILAGGRGVWSLPVEKVPRVPFDHGSYR